MTSDAVNIIGFSLLGLFIVSLLVDAFCVLTWNKRYFTSGLLIFVRRVPVNHWHTNVPDLTLLEKKFRSNVTLSLTFKGIARFSYGFHEKAVGFYWLHYSPLMHGLLTFDTDTGQVVVKGYANWDFLGFSLMWSGLLVLSFIRDWLNGNIMNDSLPIVLGGIAFFVFVTGILYWIQVARFLDVASFAAQSWARKYIRENGERA